MTLQPDSAWPGQWWDLPPLILHPFEHGIQAGAMVDSIKLSLSTSTIGEAPPGKEPLLQGRYLEFRMLCLVGKDVMRWMVQCLDFAGRDAVLEKAGIRPQSFADLLVNGTPPLVGERFEKWGVLDYRRVVSRAIGVNAVFPDPPDYAVLTAGFLENYYAYADHLFACFMRLVAFPRLTSSNFGFSLYTSDEYLSTLTFGMDERLD